MDTQIGKIPQFGLYGETTLSQEPSFIHIEDIATRSSENGWHIKPHRHAKMFQLLCMYDGELDVTLDDQQISLKGGWVILIPSGVVHGFKFHPCTKGTVLSVANPSSHDQTPQSNTLFETLLLEAQIFSFNDKPVHLAQLVQYLTLIKSELDQAENDYQHIQEWLVNCILMTLRREQEEQNLRNAQPHNGRQLLPSLKQLLNHNYHQHWTVKEYAQALHVSPSTLNRLCQHHLGLSVKSLIQDRIMIEAKRRLIYTREPQDQIAYKLGFKDPAYFSRFFKKLAGETPSEYRQARNSE